MTQTKTQTATLPTIGEATINFKRTIQVRDYEPATCEITMKATFGEGDQVNVPAAIANIIAFESETVHAALGLPRNNNVKSLPMQPIQAGGDTVLKEKSGRVVEAKSVHAEIPGEASADIPGEPAAPATQAKTPVADVPGETVPATQAKAPTPPQQAADAAPASAAELSKWVGQQVQGGKLTADAVKSIYPNFKVTRLVDLKPEQIAPAYGAIQKAIQDHSAAATGL